MANRTVTHIIDAQTPQDLLDELLAVRSETQRICSLGPAPRYARLGKSVESLHAPLGRASLCARALRRKIAPGAVLHLWTPRGLTAAASVAQKTEAKLVLSLGHLPTGRVLEELPWLIAQYALVLTVPTDRAREALFRRRVEARCVAVLPPAAREINHPLQRRRRVRAALHLPENELLFVVPAEMRREAGHSWACWAHAICREVQDRGRLLLPGCSDRLPRMRFFAGTTGFGHEAFFTGQRFAREDVLAASDVAMFLYERDCGLSSLAEAMRAGVAILASRTEDLQAVLQDEQTALLVRPTDPRSAAAALLRLIEEPELRKRLALTGQAKAGDAFDADHARVRLAEIYANCDT